MIRNKQLRKIEAKRLFLMHYTDNEIMQRTGCSIIELEKWKSQEGWENEKRQLDEKCKDNYRALKEFIDGLLSDCSNPHSLCMAIKAMNRLSGEDIFQYASQIIRSLKNE